MEGRWPGVVAVWALAAVAATAVVVFLEPGTRWTVYPLVLAGSVVLTFGFQLAVGEKRGFVTRLMASTVGALVALVLVSAVGAVIP